MLYQSTRGGRTLKKVLVTGATGFVGKHLCHTLLTHGYSVIGAVRNPNKLPPALASHNAFETLTVDSLDGNTDWGPAPKEVDVVIHLAARVHQLNETTENPEAIYQKINCDATTNLAQQAQRQQVKKFIFISTIKVLGELTLDKPLDEHSTPNPQDPYAKSKYQAELALDKIALTNNQMQIVTLRPPLFTGQV